MIERLITSGHGYSTVMDYSINQVIAFCDLLAKRHRIEEKATACITRLAVWSEGKAFDKWIKGNG